MEIKNHLNRIKRIINVPVEVTTLNTRIPNKKLGNIVNQEHEVYPDETHYLDDRYSQETKNSFATIFTLTNSVNSEESIKNKNKPVVNKHYVKGKVWFDYMSLYSFSEIINKIIIIFDISYYGNIQIIVPKTLDPIINPNNYIMVIRIYAQHFISFRSEDGVNSPLLSQLHIYHLNSHLSYEIACDEYEKQKIIYEIKFNQIYNMKQGASNGELFILPSVCNIIIKNADTLEETRLILTELIIDCYLILKGQSDKKKIKSIKISTLHNYLRYIQEKIEINFDKLHGSKRLNKITKKLISCNLIIGKINNTQQSYINIFNLIIDKIDLINIQIN